MPHRRFRAVTLALLLSAAVGACSHYEPMDVTDNKELNKGKPGLFSGKDGVFTVFSK